VQIAMGSVLSTQAPLAWVAERVFARNKNRSASKMSRKASRVIPAQAGIQLPNRLDSRLRGNGWAREYAEKEEPE
jgi:hypothetical protein